MPQRRGFFLVLGMGILLSGLTGLDAPAQQPAEPKGKKYALLIGVQDYDVNELHSLNFAEADVSSLAETLRLGGYEPGNIVLLTQTVGAKKARFLPAAGHIKKELDLLLADLDRDDSVLIAFAGHGVQFQGEDGSYFCPMDAKLEKCGAGLKVLLVDACRNDPGPRRPVPAPKSTSRASPGPR